MPDLTDDDKATLTELLRETIERDRFPLSPRVRRFEGDPREARPAHAEARAAAPPKPPGERSVVLGKKMRR
jgi:hypothetical protein